ncbi:RdgB/HAM1 family non-canonical purine NTP pyrophosphatase [Candidatus Persebacteraceae bacterium Df01]|jgi:XTP/dITP diphosphohydrolase|uniref:dITP/XTP pyrophosphatase n=1 Tax=Candidatus Doriopsillibacter californiensis TaxID=2970740 RepID=A0ABT7QM80_9GAMM|nr:RdgB/HAM1 family non-canonical purine NTP pyrophosphatase [Candidatus Persebacteraceae bacterium Df01]
MSFPTIVIASGNTGKVREIRAALQPLAARLPCLADLGLNGAEEPYGTFFENALAKARAAAAVSGETAVADDSGLVVKALNGAPGVHSARYGGDKTDDATNNNKLLQEMVGKKDRTAFYYAAMVLVQTANDPAPMFAEGFWCGEIINESRGDGGFGYDPLFYDPRVGKTGAQMTLEEKEAVSHRGQSLRELMRLIKTRRF